MKETTISMFEVQIKNFIESIRPANQEIRKQLDISYSWDNQSAIFLKFDRYGTTRLNCSKLTLQNYAISNRVNFGNYTGYVLLENGRHMNLILKAIIYKIYLQLLKMMNWDASLDKFTFLMLNTT